MPTLIQISDTHLSPVQGFFYENFRRVTDAINDEQPDVVVASGDLSVNGPSADDDLAFARWAHDRIEAPVHFLPGNHDIGEEPGEDKVTKKISEKRLKRFHHHFGPCRFEIELGDWKLVGLNSQILNTGFQEEHDQWGWLEGALEHDGPIGVFQHKPLFAIAPDEPPRPRLTIAPAVQDRLLQLYLDAGVRFIGSGHIHLHRHKTFHGIDHIWCPSTAFHPSRLPEQFDGSLGYMKYTFEGDRFTAELVKPEGLLHRSLTDVRENGRYKYLKDVPPEPVNEDWR